MIDITLVREQPQLVKENIKRKFQEDKIKLVDELLDKDREWRNCKDESDNLRGERNKISQAINKAKTEKDEKLVKKLIAQAHDIPQKIKHIEEKPENLLTQIHGLQAAIPNIMSNQVPLGKDASKNKVIKKIGVIPKFSYPVKSHIEIIDGLGKKIKSSSTLVEKERKQLKS